MSTAMGDESNVRSLAEARHRRAVRELDETGRTLQEQNETLEHMNQQLSDLLADPEVVRRLREAIRRPGR